MGELYLFSVVQKVVDSIHEGAPMGLLYGVKFFKGSDLVWVHHCFEMQRAWEGMGFFLTDAELKYFSVAPIDVEGRVWYAYMVFLKYYDGSNVDAVKIFKICRGADDGLKEDLGRLRGDTKSLLKVVLG